MPYIGYDPDFFINTRVGSGLVFCFYLYKC